MNRYILKQVLNPQLKIFQFGVNALTKLRFKHAVRNFHSSVYLSGKLVQFELADIGEGIQSVRLKSWHVAEGQRVAQFDQLCEVESDKAAVTITSRFDGVIRRLHHQVDEVAEVGQPLVDIELPDDDATTDVTAAPPATITTPPTARDGEESRPPASPLTSPASSSLPISGSKSQILATPSVRRLASELRIDLAQVSGSGKSGRILREDLELFASENAATPAVTQSPPPPSPPSSSSSTITAARHEKEEQPDGKEDHEVKLNSVQRAMIKSMTQVCAVPLFSFCDEVRMDRLETTRRIFSPAGQSEAENANQPPRKLTMLPFIIKAVSMALHHHPGLNAHFFPDLSSSGSDPQHRLVVKAAHNIGVAMDTPHGLMVPNIKWVQRLSVLEIQRELVRLRDDATRGALQMADVQDATFAVSNIGAVGGGGTYMKPLPLCPAVMIGAIGAMQILSRYSPRQERLMYNDAIDASELGAPQPCRIAQFSWSADHRVVDGASVARFNKTLKRLLENPENMLAELR